MNSLPSRHYGRFDGTPVIQNRGLQALKIASMPNVRVNIWCCDLEGYSGYGELEGTTYMRDTKSQTITEKSLELYSDGIQSCAHALPSARKYQLFSCFQFTWPHDVAVEIANNSPELYAQGPDPMTQKLRSIY